MSECSIIGSECKHKELACEDCEIHKVLKALKDGNSNIMIFNMTNGWISTQDRLPEVNQPILIYYRSKYRNDKYLVDMARMYLYSEGNDVRDRDCAYAYAVDGCSSVDARQVRYWFPIPEPPKLEISKNWTDDVWTYEPLRYEGIDRYEGRK